MLALQNGVDIKTVSGMLGRFSAGFTLDTYAHVTTVAQKEAANIMANVLSCAAQSIRIPILRFLKLELEEGSVLSHKSGVFVIDMAA